MIFTTFLFYVLKYRDIQVRIIFTVCRGLIMKCFHMDIKNIRYQAFEKYFLFFICTLLLFLIQSIQSFYFGDFNEKK